MTPIKWLFCLAILWTIAADIQAQKVQPLVMAVYVREDKRETGTVTDTNADNDDTRTITLTDAKEENIDSLKLLFSNMQPTYVALLCGDTEEDSKKSKFNVKQLTDKIDSIDVNITCEYPSQPGVRRTTNSDVNFYFLEIGFEPTYKYLQFLHNFKKEFHIRSQNDYGTGKYLEIKYEFNLNVPVSAIHRVKAHMHSNEYEKECKEIYIPDEKVDKENRSYEDLVTIFKSKKDRGDYQWRQLVPMQDFTGIYPTQATCIYLNYMLLNEKAIESLDNLEIFIRKVVDVIGEVVVVSETHMEEARRTDHSRDAIPTVVLKNITVDLNGTHYGVSMVIHNEITKRVCDSVEGWGWGWPEHNNNQEEIKIGTMYYCSPNPKDFKPFNLNGIKPNGRTSILKMIEPM